MGGRSRAQQRDGYWSVAASAGLTSSARLTSTMAPSDGTLLALFDHFTLFRSELSFVSSSYITMHAAALAGRCHNVLPRFSTLQVSR